MEKAKNDVVTVFRPRHSKDRMTDTVHMDLYTRVESSIERVNQGIVTIASGTRMCMHACGMCASCDETRDT